MASLKVLQGPNFSGRSDLLNSAVNRERNDFGRPVAYIGPDAFTSFSGLAATLTDEIALCAEHRANTIVTRLGLEALAGRTLSTLSGGEEALCAIATAIEMPTRLIAIDCAFEQLDAERREDALRALAESEATDVLICDNRLRDWGSDIPAEQQILRAAASASDFLPIRSDITIPYIGNAPCGIRISNVRHRYGRGPWVLDGVDLTLQPGRVLHLTGTNGSGKSTLAKILVGAIRPASGEIEILPADAARQSTLHEPGSNKKQNSHRTLWDRPGQVFAYHFQNPDAQLFCESVKEEILISARRPGRSAGEVMDLVNASVQAFGLDKVLLTHPHDLPYVIRKRIALAATFACGTGWIILDEPTLGQDDDSLDELVELVRRTAAQGIGFIVISHSQGFVSRLGAEQIVLSTGRVSATKDNEA